MEEQKYGSCMRCKQESTPHRKKYWKELVSNCNSKRFQQNFNNWTSGNDDIDKFIQNNLLSTKNEYHLLEWIPYNRFRKVIYITEDGFGKTHVANWIDVYFWKHCFK
ncbi:hypothetical protein C1646_775040 [Rhizophagus diaphanus]|nr:hypothetical protein C1646_775040 [Rhizophagus diaphanus] [Rhizophagus sp. MUCL 43196]